MFGAERSERRQADRRNARAQCLWPTDYPSACLSLLMLSAPSDTTTPSHCSPAATACQGNKWLSPGKPASSSVHRAGGKCQETCIYLTNQCRTDAASRAYGRDSSRRSALLWKCSGHQFFKTVWSILLLRFKPGRSGQYTWQRVHAIWGTSCYFSRWTSSTRIDFLTCLTRNNITSNHLAAARLTYRWDQHMSCKIQQRTNLCLVITTPQKKSK